MNYQNKNDLMNRKIDAVDYHGKPVHENEACKILNDFIQDKKSVSHQQMQAAVAIVVNEVFDQLYTLPDALCIKTCDPETHIEEKRIELRLRLMKFLKLRNRDMDADTAKKLILLLQMAKSYNYAIAFKDLVRYFKTIRSTLTEKEIYNEITFGQIKLSERKIKRDMTLTSWLSFIDYHMKVFLNEHLVYEEDFRTIGEIRDKLMNMTEADAMYYPENLPVECTMFCRKSDGLLMIEFKDGCKKKYLVNHIPDSVLENSRKYLKPDVSLMEFLSYLDDHSNYDVCEEGTPEFDDCQDMSYFYYDCLENGNVFHEKDAISHIQHYEDNMKIFFADPRSYI